MGKTSRLSNPALWRKFPDSHKPITIVRLYLWVIRFQTAKFLGSMLYV